MKQAVVAIACFIFFTVASSGNLLIVSLIAAGERVFYLTLDCFMSLSLAPASNLVVDRVFCFKDAPSEQVARRLHEETTLPLLVCRMLAQRGYTDKEQVRAFLRPTHAEFHDPFLMKDLSRAVARLVLARERGETILVHGDYDVDGLTSTALYTRVLRALGFRVEAFVPHRLIDGYGVSVRGVAEYLERGVDVLLTCDTGIAAKDEIAQIVQEHGLEVLVTDHHHVPNEIPVAHAVINPHQHDCPYPFKSLSGVGVAFKLMQGLVRKLGLAEEDVLYPYLDLVALGTIADIVPLVGENRVIARLGLRRMRETSNHGIRAILDAVGVGVSRVDERTCGWVIGPRLNAIGRLDDAGVGLDLLLTDDSAEATRLARIVEVANQRRRSITQQIEEEAVAMVEAIPNFDDIWGIALFGGEGWHVGVVGIVASRLVERYGRPVFLFARDQESGLWKGSGRAPDVPHLHLAEMLAECADYLKAFGGHERAAGATLKTGTLEEQNAFALAFNHAAKRRMTEADRVPVISIDLVVDLQDITSEFYRYYRMFAPFGEGNAPLTMLAKGVEVLRVRRTRDGRNIQLSVTDGSTVFNAIAWGLAERRPELLSRRTPFFADIVFSLGENEWNGRKELQLIVADVTQLS